MNIGLCVTKKVLSQVNSGNIFQKQIVFGIPSEDRADRLKQVNANNRFTLILNGFIYLSAGDTKAIWRSPQQPGCKADDFEDLFSLLARRPGKWVTFSADISIPELTGGYNLDEV